MIGRIIDRLAGLVSPSWGASRLRARASLQAIEALLGGASGYDAARINRLNALRLNLNENAIDSGQLERLRADAKDLWRNNPHARKVVRQIQTKAIGTGIRPIPQAKGRDGKPHFAFRRRAKEVWSRFVTESDYRGKPGLGGDHFVDQNKSAMAAVIRQGNCLFRIRSISEAERSDRGLMLPLTMQLVDADRLDETVGEFGGNRVFRGIELTSSQRVAAYHVLPFHPSDPLGTGVRSESTRIPSGQMGHLFVSEDIDQCLGVTWFAPALSGTRDVGDYTYTELKAAAMGACIVAGIRRPQGMGAFGLQSETEDLTDSDGNRITRLQPGMFFDLGSDGAIEGFNPQRPSTNAEGFVQHLLRILSTAFPGIKGATLTGDYRGSSFSSERSADNEIWPEIEGVQQWWSCSLLQPVYEQVIVSAVLMGLFDDILRPGEFESTPQAFLASAWQGPVCRSINPKDDQEASQLALQNRTSSVFVEAGKHGRDALEVLQDTEEYLQHVDSLAISDEMKLAIAMQAIGASQPKSQQTAPANGTASHGIGNTGNDRLLQISNDWP